MLLDWSSQSMPLQISLLGSWSLSTCRFMATEGVELTNFWCNFATNWGDLMLRGCGNASSRETWWNYLVSDGCHSGKWTNETIRMWFLEKKLARMIVWYELWKLWIFATDCYKFCLYYIGAHVPLVDRLGFMCLHGPGDQISVFIYHFLMSYHVYITLSTTFSCMNISVQTQRDLQKLADILASSSFCGGVWGHGWGSPSTMQGSFLCHWTWPKVWWKSFWVTPVCWSHLLPQSLRHAMCGVAFHLPEAMPCSHVLKHQSGSSRSTWTHLGLLMKQGWRSQPARTYQNCRYHCCGY